MQIKFFFRTLSAILALVMVLGMLPLAALATTAEPAAQAEETRYLLYSEDFDSYTTKVDLANGTNDSGWIYSKKSTNGYAYMENGKLYFAGSKYDVLYRAGGEVWGNYTVEADISYNTDNAGWAGLAYNVQSDTKYQKASVATGGGVGLNGYDAAYSGGWTNNDATLNKTTLAALGLTNSFASGQMRFKVSVNNTSATLWIAQYTNGVLGSWIKAKEISNIYEDAQTGSVGFMSSNGSLGSIVVDNIKVYADSLVSFTEDFDAYEGTVSLSAGNNSGAGKPGVFFHQGNNGATSYIQDGKLYLDASTNKSHYEHIYFTAGMNWTDYVVEMDLCTSADWIGMLHRVGGENNFQKAGVNIGGGTSLYGYTGVGIWQHNSGVNKGTSTVKPVANQTYRLRVTVVGQSATLDIALYDANNILGDYTQVLSASNLYAEHTKGSVGFMLNQNTNLKAWIDNVVVSRYDAGEIIPEEEQFTVTYVAEGVTVDTFTVNSGDNVPSVPEVPAKEGFAGVWDHDGSNITADTVINAVYTEVEPIIGSVVADIYLPQTGIINPPTVVQKVTSSLPAASGRTPAVALMEIDENLNIEGTGATVEAFYETCGDTTIPAFVIDSQAEVDALIAFISHNQIIDAFVAADSANAALVKAVRQACPKIRGVIRFENITDNQTVLNTINENLAYVAISEAPVGLETVTYFHLRQRAVWCEAVDTADMYQAIAAGWSGMISTDTDAVYDLYESITDITITGQALPIAHRGEHINTPENTLEAFRSAVENYGVLAVETDLRLTADGDIILDHDGSLDRTTDYENRTDVFTKGNLTSSYTVEELKQLNVDYTGGSYKLATFEEALAEFADEGLVFYAHINGTDAQIPGIISRLEELLEEYDAYDNVVLFIGYAYHDAFNTMDGAVTDKISVTVGHTDTLTSAAEDQVCIENFINELAADNCQPLFYNYGDHKGWNFYYKLSARGFVNSHSISNTQAYLDGIFLRDWGVVGALTDDIHMTTSYVHKIAAEDSQIVAGSLIDTTYDLVKTVGMTEQVECDYIQLSGPEIINGVMSEAGTAEVVFYTTCYTPSSGDYRVYSAPVTITATEGVAVAQWNISLRDDICPNYHLIISDTMAADAVVNVSVGNGNAVSYPASNLSKTAEGYYVVSAPLAAAQMTDDIHIQVLVNGEEVLFKTYTVAQYAHTILGTQSYGQYHNLVRAMLNYGAKAQLYFSHNTNNLADAGYEIQTPVNVPDVALDNIKEGSVEGISFYGASLVYLNKISVRYYFTAENGVAGYTFQVDGKPYEASRNGSMYYVEIPGINPQEYRDIITLTVSDGTSSQSIGYSPMHYITRMYNRDTTAESLKNLLCAMYGYHLAADGTVNSVNTGSSLLITEGYDSSEKYVVLSANVKSLSELTYGWKNTVAFGVSGTDAWANYAFQLSYGENAQQNLVKLVDGMGYDGNEILQEQWYNNQKLEKLFDEDGIDIKVVRMDTRGYLLADMGDGYELIGAMILPANSLTQFMIYNQDTALQLRDIAVETGKDAALAAFNGLDLTIDSTPLVLPVDSESWTVEGRLVIDTATFTWNTADYRMYAGANGWDQAISVFYSATHNSWYLQDHTNWANVQIPDEHWWMVSQESGGMYVRFVKNGSMLTVWTSKDGVSWNNTLSMGGITGNNIYLVSTLVSELRDLTISNKAVLKQQKQSPIYIPADYTNANYAVFEANIKANDAITHDWASNILVSVSGEVWDAYDFQILYGSSSEQNLIKLTGDTTTMDGATAEKEQWVNNPDLEKIFTEDGMNIKVVRMNTWVYLLVDMGSGYELVGRMYLPADQVTRFGVFNHDTAIQISDYSVKTGEAAAVLALNGLDLNISTNYYVLPIESDSWTLEGRLVIDTDNFPWWQQDYRMYAGADGWEQAVSVFYSASNKWYLQNHTSWSNTVLPDEEWWMVSQQKGGMYVRFEKSGSTLTLSTSKDGVNWVTSLNHDSITAKGIYLYATLVSELRDIQLTIGE